ncbi:hypothetical protein [Phreatobacter stygius]|uniref:Uncharacterized protein n=1 Tax=Phreatobacter stygius TaxID=1940610 RepID=A0A4D7B1F7_9HYPH|nr:hypothetical protein [Phreatobacter stygius]QCI67539.1 hypothetical protein E8M01_26945 [Phreatobacter stygius]
MLTSALAWVALAAAALWLLSFWPRYVASQLGLPAKAFLRKPWARGLKPYQDHWPFISYGFYRFLITRGHVLEMILAVITFVMVSRALSVFLKTAGAVARGQS